MHDDFISHYGVKRRSGRYPWGSGDNPYQGDKLNGIVKALQKSDLASVADSLGISNKHIYAASRDYGAAKRMLNQIAGGEIVMTESDYESAKRVINKFAGGGGRVSESDYESVNNIIEQVIGIDGLELTEKDYESAMDTIQKLAEGGSVEEITKESYELVKKVVKKVGFWNIVWATVKKMGLFFKRTISSIISKFKD